MAKASGQVRSVQNVVSNKTKTETAPKSGTMNLADGLAPNRDAQFANKNITQGSNPNNKEVNLKKMTLDEFKKEIKERYGWDADSVVGVTAANKWAVTPAAIKQGFKRGNILGMDVANKVFVVKAYGKIMTFYLRGGDDDYDV